MLLIYLYNSCNILRTPLLFDALHSPRYRARLPIHRARSFGRRFGRDEEATAQAHQSQLRDIGRVAAGARHRTRDRGQDSPNAEMVRPVQKRRRLGRDPRYRQKAPRQDAQIPDRREARGSRQVRATHELRRLREGASGEASVATRETESTYQANHC
jgi:hypothetical protein